MCHVLHGTQDVQRILFGICAFEKKKKGRPSPCQKNLHGRPEETELDLVPHEFHLQSLILQAGRNCTRHAGSAVLSNQVWRGQSARTQYYCNQ